MQPAGVLPVDKRRITLPGRPSPIPQLWRMGVKVPPLVSRIYAEFSEDRIPAVSGGVTFFFLLALFPAIASVVSVYGLFADRQSILESLQMVSGFLPGGAVTVLGAEVHRLADQKPAALNIAFLLSSGVALWSTS